MKKNLPSRPNLHHLKAQAKDLLAALNSHDEKAAQTFLQFLPSAAQLGAKELFEANLRLADAQSAIARQSGFASWPGLSKHVQTLRALEGTWEFESLEVNGDSVPSMGARILIDGDKFRSEMGPDVYEGEFVIDVDEDPFHIDIDFASGPEAGNTSRGLFKLDGDTWTICLGFTGLSRPLAFETTDGSGHALEVLRRFDAARPVRVDGGQGPEVVAVQPTEITDIHSQLEGNWPAEFIIMNGKPLPAKWMKDAYRRGAGSVMEVVVGGQRMMHCDVAIDASQNPIHVAYTTLTGPNAGQVQLGIMRWTDDGVEFCIAAYGKSRPEHFQGGPTVTWSRWNRP